MEPRQIVIARPDGSILTAVIDDVSEPENIGDTIQYTITARMFPAEQESFWKPVLEWDL